ncbi:hypothetical protein [Pedobacter sp. SYP-B3415]|uniref:hypothetical protein n=1 Tax=Pedobacter sp. SYP-B3415 TaxID=2496641 RepID=UPI00101B779B|nr:hypothetical protein [Pedobacter sp. SYP-B3415]
MNHESGLGAEPLSRQEPLPSLTPSSRSAFTKSLSSGIATARDPLRRGGGERSRRQTKEKRTRMKDLGEPLNGR